MKLIVGLGNPGDRYLKTRHNTGFIILDSYLKDVKWQKRFDALIYKTLIDKVDYIFLKPLTYMNNSGISVKKVVDFYKISIENILIIHDDIDMEIGTYKLKQNSGSGGHNGIKSIQYFLGTNNIKRLKIGIKGENYYDTRSYVLENFTVDEYSILISKLADFDKIIEDFGKLDFSQLANKYNHRGKE